MSSKPKRIVLYADDDPDDRDFVREAFAEHTSDIELVTFPDGIELFKFICHTQKNTESPCLIILDVNMPMLSGKETLRMLRGRKGYEDTPVILFTTSISPHDASFAERYGAGFISKPLTEKQMDLIVERFLDHCNEGVKN